MRQSISLLFLGFALLGFVYNSGITSNGTAGLAWAFSLFSDSLDWLATPATQALASMFSIAVDDTPLDQIFYSTTVSIGLVVLYFLLILAVSRRQPNDIQLECAPDGDRTRTREDILQTIESLLPHPRDLSAHGND